MEIALAQICPSEDLRANLQKMEQLVAQASEQKAKLIAFGEMAYLMGRKKDWLGTLEKYEALVTQFKKWAARYEIDLLPGTLREPSPDPERPWNTLLYIDRTGKQLAQYRKLFLFSANLPDRRYEEKDSFLAGNQVCAFKSRLGSFGLSICFDLRFPELYRSLKEKGAQIILIPSAFTVPTGRAHWEVLLRSRAIENQCFVYAPALVGKCGDGRTTHGHSMIVSPWGEILVDMGEKEGIEICTIELESIKESQQKVDAWSCRRGDLFPIG